MCNLNPNQMKQTNIENLIEYIEKGIEKYGDHLFGMSTNKKLSLLTLSDVLSKAKSLQQEEPSGWISVGTELPSKMGLYLIYDENYGKPYTSTLRFTYTKKWINDSGDEFHPQYWQPLPNKPKQ